MQVRINVPPDYWQKLLDATECWPADRRNQTSICRYAMSELAYEDGEIPEPAPVGTTTIRYETSSTEDVRHYEVLSDRYGSGAAALRVAIASLYEYLVSEEAPDLWGTFDAMSGEDILGQSISDLRSYAACHLGISGASKMPGGKTSLVQHILKIRGSGHRDSA